MTAIALIVMTMALAVVVIVVRHECLNARAEWPECHYDPEVNRCIGKLDREIRKKK